MPSSCTGPVTGLPATSIAPSVVGSRPAIMLSSVLLPQPLGPTIETNSPRPIARLTSSTACTSPWRERKCFDTPRTDTAASLLSAAPAGSVSRRTSVMAPLSVPCRLLRDELVGVVGGRILRRDAAVGLEHRQHLLPVVLGGPADRMALRGRRVQLLLERDLEAFAQHVLAEIGIELEARRHRGVRILGGGFPALLRRGDELLHQVGRLFHQRGADDEAGAVGDQPVLGIGDILRGGHAGAGAQEVAGGEAGE